MNKHGEQNYIGESRMELLGVATILVIIVHATHYNWGGYLGFLYKICTLGSVGVDVFLLLSGMGLYYSMQKCGSVVAFYKHRIIRIMPAYLIITGVLYGIGLFIHSISLTDYFLQISTLYYWIRGEAATWYVSFIILLYLLYPGIYRILIGEKWVRNIALLFGIIITAEIGLYILIPEFYSKYESALSRILIFLIGTVLGKREFENKGYSAWNLPIYCIGFVLIRAVLLRFGNPQTVLYTTGHHLSYIPGALFIAEFIPFLRRLGGGMPDNPVRHILEALGSVSLEIYLVHLIYSGIFRSLKIYQTYNTPIVYMVFVVLPSIMVVILAKYFLQRVKTRDQI